MRKKKIVKWKVSTPVPGGCRSIAYRNWPTAHYSNNDDIAAKIECAESYVPGLAKIGNHPPLTLRVADYSATTRTWRKVKGEIKTLDDAKMRFIEVITRFPHLKPRI